MPAYLAFNLPVFVIWGAGLSSGRSPSTCVRDELARRPGMRKTDLPAPGGLRVGPLHGANRHWCSTGRSNVKTLGRPLVALSVCNIHVFCFAPSAKYRFLKHHV